MVTKPASYRIQSHFYNTTVYVRGVCRASRDTDFNLVFNKLGCHLLFSVGLTANTAMIVFNRWNWNVLLSFPVISLNRPIIAIYNFFNIGSLAHFWSTVLWISHLWSQFSFRFKCCLRRIFYLFVCIFIMYRMHAKANMRWIWLSDKQIPDTLGLWIH